MTHEAQDNSTGQLPDDLAACHALIEQERARNEELAAEYEKLRKLLSHFVNGSRSEKRILDCGARVCLSKPLDLDSLLKEVETSL